MNPVALAGQRRLEKAQESFLVVDGENASWLGAIAGNHILGNEHTACQPSRFPSPAQRLALETQLVLTNQPLLSPKDLEWMRAARVRQRELAGVIGLEPGASCDVSENFDGEYDRVHNCAHKKMSQIGTDAERQEFVNRSLDMLQKRTSILTIRV